MLEMTEDRYALEDIATDNNIDAGLFIPFTIARLLGLAEDAREVVLSVTLVDVEEMGVSGRHLRLRWSAQSASTAVEALQEHTVTEFAACGVACVVTPLYARLKVLRVAQVGDRFDYWLGDEEGEMGLEVSGTKTGTFLTCMRRRPANCVRIPSVWTATSA